MEWWELFDASLEDIQMIVHSIITLYNRKRIQWLPDVESQPDGTKSIICSLDKSRIVSPAIEEKSMQFVANTAVRDNAFEPKGWFHSNAIIL